MKTATKKKAVESEQPVQLEKPKDATPLEMPLKIELIDISKIKFDQKTDRQGKTDVELKIPELAHSIASVGLKQPIDVVRLPNGEMHCAFGERRTRAYRLNKESQIPAIVHDAEALTDVVLEQIAEARSVENIQRLDPSPIGESVAIADLFDIQYAREVKRFCEAEIHTPEQITVSQAAIIRREAIRATAASVGKPVDWVRDRMFLAGFSGAARDLVTSGKLPLAHAREIAKVADPRTRDDLATRYAAGGATNWQREAWQAGRIDELKVEVAKNLYSLTTVPWNLTSPFDGKPACAECPFNSANNPGLFEGSQVFVPDARSKSKVGSGRHDGVKAKPEPAAGVCTKSSCYMEKTSFASRALSGAASKVVNRFEAARAAKKKDASTQLGMANIREVTPEFIDPAAVKERAQARLHPPKKKASSRSHVTFDGGLHETPAQKARWQAERAFGEAEREWVDKIVTPAFASYLAKVPGRWAMFALVLHTKACEQAMGWNAKAKSIEAPQLLSLLKLIDKPSMETVLKIQAACGVRFGFFERFNGRDNRGGFAAQLCKSLGIEVGETPKLKTFIDKEMAKIKPAAKTGKKPAASKSKARTDEQEDDDE